MSQAVIRVLIWQGCVCDVSDIDALKELTEKVTACQIFGML